MLRLLGKVRHREVQERKDGSVTEEEFVTIFEKGLPPDGLDFGRMVNVFKAYGEYLLRKEENEERARLMKKYTSMVGSPRRKEPMHSWEVALTLTLTLTLTPTLTPTLRPIQPP